MKKKNARTNLFVFAALSMSLPLMSGCNIYNLFHSSSEGSGGQGGTSQTLPPTTSSHHNDFDGYYQKSGDASCTFHDIGSWNESPFLPTKGNLNVLVVPVEFDEYPFSSDTLKDITTLTSGKASDTKYWESLSSYYSKSSYGKLNLNFVQGDVLNVGTISGFINNSGYSSYPEAAPEYAMAEGVKAYKLANGNTSTKQFDSDADGYIDAVIMIYSAPNMTNEKRLERYGNLFWAYCYQPRENIAGVNYSPVGFRYFWASYDFFYEGTTNALGRHTGVDAHTLIHEAGHLMGADDYYNAIAEGSDIAEPSGNLMMMGCNVCDHDMFTKLCFDWINPYCVTGDCTISIKPSQENGDCIILADSWNGTGFDEFLIIDYVTPTGLNELDSKTLYPKYAGNMSQTGFKKSGIRVFHVDNRLVYGIGYSEDGSFEARGIVSDDDVINFKDYAPTVTYQGTTYYAAIAPGVTNSKGYDCTIFQGKGYELIQMIQKGGRYTFGDGGSATDNDLFYQGDSFNMSQYSAFFPNKTKLNNGNVLPFSFEVTSLTASEAVLTFTKG